MEGLVYHFSLPNYVIDRSIQKLAKGRYHHSLKFDRGMSDIKLIGQQWVVVKSLFSGICGSDLNMLDGNESLSMEPYASFPCAFGHENVGVISEIGSAVKGLRVGQLICIDPAMNCAVRELPLCSSCEANEPSLCLNFADSSRVDSGLSLGYCSSTGGGWSEYFQAHESQIVPVIDSIEPLSLYALVDPLASALRPVLQAADGKSEPKEILVYGAGTIGQLLAYAIKALKLPWTVSICSRYDFQSEMARCISSPKHVFESNGSSLFKDICKAKNWSLIKPMIGPPSIKEGFDFVFDCVGSEETVGNSLRMVKPRGRVFMTGISGTLKNIDPTPLWFREVSLSGSCMGGVGKSVDGSGSSVRIHAEALRIISTSLSPLISHEFEINEYRQALNVAGKKKRFKSMKVVFRHSQNLEEFYGLE